jgi:DNA-binding MarR family transcriptional regulator
MFKDLDPMLHSQVRLSIMSVLVGIEQAEFNYLLEKTRTTTGNLSVQINNLSEAGYIEVTKGFRGKYPLTTCRITPTGLDAFEKYVEALEEYLNVKKKIG